MENFNPFSLENKTILVTGASSGIGKGVAIACAKMGATVILTARNEARLHETLQLMPQGNHAVIAADITQSDDLQKLVSSLPKLDGVAYCAGVGSLVPCKSLDQAAIDYVMKPNFMAPALLMSSILSNKKLNKSASVIFVASRAYETPIVGNAAYSASKGAIVSYAKCLALELAPRLIRVNCICPAMIWTNLILQDAVTKEELEERSKAYPLKRYGQPEDVANLAIYLLSDAASWMTGAAIDITGGSM